MRRALSRLTHQWRSAISIHAIDRDGAGAALEQELYDLGHVEPSGHTKGSHVVDRVLWRVEGEKRDVRVRGCDADDIETVLGHERRVGRVDGLPPVGATGSGEVSGGGRDGDVPVCGECTGEDGAARGVGGVDVSASVEGVLNGGNVAFGGSLEEGKVFKGAVWATHCGSSGVS